MVTTDDGAAGRAGLAPMTVIDIAPYLAGARRAASQVAAAVGGACESLGFFGVVGHGVPDQAVDDMETVSRAFFALPLAEKMGYKPRRWLDFVGYYPPESLAAAATIGERGPKDLFEAFSCGPYYEFRVPGAGEDPLFGPNIWPVRPSKLREIWMSYYREMEQLSTALLRIFALALGLGESWFEDQCRGHLSELIVNHYPTQDRPPLPRQVRQGAHTDFGTLTILRASDGVPGLQVRCDDSWLDVPHVPDGFIINVSDLMTRWTNGLFVSPLHRVDNPPAEYATQPRMTIPFFHNPAAAAVISPAPTTVTADRPARFDPVIAGEWISRKLGRPAGARTSR
jgi:isopenicillin N synthase-like dioxygenase